MTPEELCTVPWLDCFRITTYVSGYVVSIRWCLTFPAVSLQYLPSEFLTFDPLLTDVVSSLFQLAASRSLCFHIEDATFSEQDFSDLLPKCWNSCFKLVEEVHEFESKVNQNCWYHIYYIFVVNFSRSRSWPFDAILLFITNTATCLLLSCEKSMMFALFSCKWWDASNFDQNF